MSPSEFDSGGGNEGGRLSAIFLAHLAPGDERFAKWPDLERRLEAALADAKAAWPELELADEVFVSHLGERVGPEPDAAKVFEGVQAKDLFLACACCRGDDKAMALFEKRYGQRVREAVGRVDASPSFVDEAQQVVRQRLFLPEGPSNAKICEYSGRGSLVNWLRAVALRVALNLKRGAKDEAVGLDLQSAEDLSLQSDPELEYLRERYQKDFREAFQKALDTLTSQEITVLRLQLIDGLNIDKIGALYQAHRSTVARWIARSREKLLEETRKALAERLKLTPSELDSLIGFVQSQLDVSIARMLKSSGRRKGE